MSLNGKVAVVTGATNDVGIAVVEVLASRGARVLAVDDNFAALAALASEDVAVVAADVTRPGDVVAYVSRALELWGGIDLFFNNVDVDGPEVPLPDYPDTAFEEILLATVRTVFLGLKHMLPRMRDGGAVVNLAGALGIVGSAGMAAQVAAKHAVLGLTKVAALECEPRGIRVNAICPDPAGLHNEVETPDDVAHLVAFLFSDAGPVHHRAGAFAEIVLPAADQSVVPDVTFGEAR